MRSLRAVQVFLFIFVIALALDTAGTLWKTDFFVKGENNPVVRYIWEVSGPWRFAAPVAWVFLVAGVAIGLAVLKRVFLAKWMLLALTIGHFIGFFTTFDDIWRILFQKSFLVDTPAKWVSIRFLLYTSASFVVLWIFILKKPRFWRRQ